MTFEEFLDAELDDLRRYAFVLTGDRQLAHDVLADTLIKAQVKWSKVVRSSHPPAYVRRMVTNTFLSDRRRSSVRLTVATDPANLPERSDRSDRSDRSSHAAVLQLDELHRLLSTLPRQQRTAIVLRYYLDLADVDIRKEMGCSTGSVRTYISRGFAALRLGAENADDADRAEDAKNSELSNAKEPA